MPFFILTIINDSPDENEYFKSIKKIQKIKVNLSNIEELGYGEREPQIKTDIQINSK